RMNSLGQPWTPLNFETIELRHASAAQIAAQVESYIEELTTDTQQGSEGGTQQKPYAVRVIPDATRNVIIIGGTIDGVRLARDIIARLDQPGIADAEAAYLPVRVYRLDQAKAGSIGEILRNIFDARKQAEAVEGAEPTPVTVEVNEPSNSLVVNATQQDHAIIRGLLDQLDRKSEIENMFRVFPLSKAPAEKVKEILDEVYQSAQGGQAGGGQSIVTVAEERTNSIVVSAPAGELENIAGLI